MNHHSPNHSPSTALPWYASAVSALEARTAALHALSDDIRIPPGWRHLFADTVARLVAVRTKEREEHLKCLTIGPRDECLRIESAHYDPVVVGILRRCRTRSKHICTVCGRRGTLRQLTCDSAAVLCPRCTAPRLLKQAIEDVLNLGTLMSCGDGVMSVHAIPEFLRRDFANFTPKTRLLAQAGQPVMEKVAFRQWMQELRELQALYTATQGA